MIRMLTAFTEEIDEAEGAVFELTAQLGLDSKLLPNSIGILTCYSEAIDTGVVEAVCAALPFPVVGTTTISSGASGQNSMMGLSLSVLTADDSAFTPVISEPITEDMHQIDDAYKAAAAALGEKPKMALCFLPLNMQLGGESLLQRLDSVVDGVPIFGTMACDHTSDYHTSTPIYNGKAVPQSLVMVLFSGNVDPKFLRVTISEEKLQKQRAVITSSEGGLLRTINDKPAVEYMREIGLTEGDGIEGMSSVPFIVDYGDGTPAVARAIYYLMPDGSLVCGGAVPKGATLAVGSIDADDVVATSGETAKEILSRPGVAGVLMFPCLARLMVLGADTQKEHNALAQELAGNVPFQVCYSGGEVCPVFRDGGGFANRFHNYTLIACVL